MNKVIADQIAKIEGLVDEVRLKLHLASLEAKTEWSEKLEPRVQHLKNAPHQKLNELASLLESYAARLRAADITP